MVEQKNEFTIKPYFSQYNLIESWLQDQARKGSVLTGYNMGSYTFKAGEVSNRRYRVMPIGILRRKKEIQRWEECGWKHFPTGLGYQIFYTDDEDLPEVYPTKDDFRKAMSFNIASTLFWTVLAVIFIALWIRLEIEDVFISGDFDTSELVLLTMLAIPLLLWWLYAVVGSIRYICTLLNNEPINHDLPYQRNFKIGKILYYGLFVSLGLCFVVGPIMLCF